MQPTISLCMIIKNEERHLPGCLDGVKDVVDEMVIVDTGSTDSSVDIAECYGARILHHRWNNDFSEARNTALQHATGEWILHLDADELMRKEDVPKLKKAINDTDTNGFQCAIYSVQKNSADLLISYFFRLFRNKIGVHYVGSIHETPIIPGKLSHSDIGIMHYGYALDKEGWKIKCERNIGLLRKQLLNNPNDPLIHFHLAKTYYQLKSYETALAEGNEVLRLLPRDNLETRPELEIYVLIACVLFNNGAFLNAEKKCLEAISINPDYLDPYFFLGHIYHKLGDFANAVMYFEKYQKIRSAHERGHNLQCVGLHSLTRQHEVYYALGSIHEKQKNYQRALQEYSKAVEANPQYAEAFNGLGTVYLSTGKLDRAITMLEKALSIKQDFAIAHKNLGVIYAKQNRFELAAETFDKAIQIISREQTIQNDST